MAEKVNFDSADARIGQKNSKPDTDTETRLARHEAAIKELFTRVEAAANAADLLDVGRKKMEEHMSPLTRTEKKIYLLLARGKSDKEIAVELGITPRTASMHVVNIKSKLAIDDRADFILLSPIL